MGGNSPPHEPVSFWFHFAVGVAVTPIAFVLSVMSAGSGHGSYFVARVLYPLPMLLSHITADHIGVLSISTALAQFPIYGLVIGLSREKYNRKLLSICIGIFHAIFATVALCVPV